MTQLEREMLVHRILSGVLIYNDITIGCISYRDKYRADMLYCKVLNECNYHEQWSEEDLLKFLVNQNLWDLIRQERIDALPQEMEDCKVELFNCVFKSLDKIRIKEKINALKIEFEKLYRERHKYDHLTNVGVATMAKTKYLIGCSLRKNGKKIFKGDWWESPGDLIDRCMNFIVENKLSDNQLRELARTEPWRSHWNARKAGMRLFHNKFFTDEQMSLVSWTGIYDNIYGHPECPSQSIIEDDDALDGWMIVQRRKRGDSEIKNDVDKLIKNPKIRNSQEIFLVAQTPDDAKKIDSLNNAAASIAKAQKFAAVKQKGSVNEVNMPDVRQRIQMEMNQKSAEKIRSF